MIDLMLEFNRLRGNKYSFTQIGTVVSPPSDVRVHVELTNGTAISGISPHSIFFTVGSRVLVVSTSDGFDTSYAIYPLTKDTVIDNTNFLAAQPTQLLHDNTPTRKATYKCSWCGATNDANKHALECRQCSGPRNAIKEKVECLSEQCLPEDIERSS